MKKCPNCQIILEEDDKFCPECGTKIDAEDANVEKLAKEINEDIKEALNETKNESSDMLINYKHYLKKESKVKKILKIIIYVFLAICALGFVSLAYDYYVYYDQPLTAITNLVIALLLILFIILNYKNKKFAYVFLVISFVLMPLSNKVEEVESLDVIDWSIIKLGDYVPELDIYKGEIYTNSNESLNIGNIQDFDVVDYHTYIEECKDFGYVIDVYEDEYTFNAYNEDGYRLKLYYYDDVLDLYCDGPINMNYFYWPTSSIASLLPEPSYLYGKIDYDSVDSLSIYLGDMTYEDFIDYTNECIEGNFGEDYYRHDDYFSGTYENYHLNISYEGYNTIYINIYNTDY